MLRAISRSWSWGGSVALTCALLFPSAARADDDKRTEAERVFAAGDQAYAAGKNLAAAHAYEAAYELTPLPEITFSIAQAYRRYYFEDPDPRWLKLAESLYRRYLVEAPDGSRRAHAVTHLANIALLLAEEGGGHDGASQPPVAPTEILVSSPTPEAKATIDGGDAQPVPVVREVTPGKHHVKVTSDGWAESELDVQALDHRMVIVPLELEALPGSLAIEIDRGAEIWIDGRLSSPGSPNAAQPLVPGVHSVAVTGFGREPVTKSVTIERGKPSKMNVHLKTSDQRRAAYALFGASAALGVAGAVMAIFAAVSEEQAIEARSGLDEHRPLLPDEAARSNEALARRDLSRGLAIAGFSVGAAAGLGGTFLFVFDHKSPTSRGPHDTAIGVGLVGSF